MTKLEHTAFGIYGIYENAGRLLVIQKNGGPYTNRYDLPGGSQESQEDLTATLLREFQEETGSQASAFTQLGVTSFHYPWNYLHYTSNRHLAVFYHIETIQGDLRTQAPQFEGQDSLGCALVPLTELTLANSSPLVLHAKDYLLSGSFQTESVHFPSWTVLDQPAH